MMHSLEKSLKMSEPTLQTHLRWTLHFLESNGTEAMNGDAERCTENRLENGAEKSLNSLSILTW